MGGKMRTASWVLLALLAAMTGLLSLGSAWVALSGTEDQFGVEGPTLAEVTESHPEVAPAIRARRLTAASYALGYSVLLLAITLGPYRAGKRWAWWTILAAFLLPGAVSLLRVPLLGTELGASTVLVQLVVVGVALALDARRLVGSADS